MLINLADLTFREKSLITIAFAVSIFILTRHLIYVPLYDNYLKRSRLLNHLAHEISEIESRTAEIGGLEARLSDETARNKLFRKQLAALEGLLLHKDQIKTVLDLLEKMAEQEGMKLLDISVNSENLSQNIPANQARMIYKKNIVNIYMESGYNSFAGFVQKLSGLPMAIFISRIDLTSDPLAEGSALLAKVRLELYEPL